MNDLRSSRPGTRKRFYSIRSVIICFTASVPLLVCLLLLKDFVLRDHILVPSIQQRATLSTLFNLRRSRQSRHFSVKVTSSQTNISLTLHGACRVPFTYAGTDTRTFLLTDFDVVGIPASNYSPPVMNWAKVLLLQSLHTLCMNTSSWLVYSDVDAYIVSRRRTAARLRRLPDHVHFAFMNGVWFINIGFLAFRTSTEARTLLDKWGSKYVHPPKIFFDARIYGRDMVQENRKKCAARPNGFLGWHMKGSAKWKAPLARIGRQLANGRGHFIAAVTFAFFALTACACAYAKLHNSDNDSSRKHDLPLVNLVAFRLWHFACAATKPSTVLFVIATLFLVWLAMPHGRRSNGTIVSKRSMSHALFDGRVMLDHSMTCANGESYTCTTRRGPTRVLWRAIVSVQPLTKALFTISAVIEWSGVGWFYAIAVAVRASVAGAVKWKTHVSAKAQ